MKQYNWLTETISLLPRPSQFHGFWNNSGLPVKRKALLIVFIITGFLFLLLAIGFSYHLVSQTQQFSPLLAPLLASLVAYHFEFLLALAFMGMAVGAGVFYLSLGLLEHKQKELNSSATLLLKFLSEDEREVVQLLIERHGSAYQSELSRLASMSRIKAHRVVKKLLARGLVSVARVGRINRLELAVELKDALVGKN